VAQGGGAVGSGGVEFVDISNRRSVSATLKKLNPDNFPLTAVTLFEGSGAFVALSCHIIRKGSQTHP
jgi:hypothetical protein